MFSLPNYQELKTVGFARLLALEDVKSFARVAVNIFIASDDVTSNQNVG
jgi:hypothetical protein